MNRMAHVHMAWMFFGVLGRSLPGPGARFRKSAAGHEPGGDDVPMQTRQRRRLHSAPGRAGRMETADQRDQPAGGDTNHVLSLQTQVIEGARQNENGVVAPANHRSYPLAGPNPR